MSLLSQKSVSSRVIQLDVLRGLAILLVLGRHHPLEPESSGIFRVVATPWKNFGWSGVDMFFVLSGFLIGGLLFKELKEKGTLDVKRFIIRRGLKIWPAYYLLITVVFVLVWARNHDFVLAVSIMWPNFLHIQNYIPNPQRPLWLTWSLAVEEHFYLMLPVLIWFCWGSAQRYFSVLIPLISFVVGVFCLVCRFRMSFLPFDTPTYTFPTHLRIDSLFCGVLLAYIYHFQAEKWKQISRYPLLFLVLGLGLLLPVSLVQLETTPWVATWGFCLLYLGYASILVAALSWPVRENPRVVVRFLSWIGLSSYPIYLWHGLLGHYPSLWLATHSPLPDSLRWIVVTAVYLLLSLTSGVLFGALVDRPVLAWRNQLFPPHSQVF